MPITVSHSLPAIYANADIPALIPGADVVKH